jgi:hypothetical protein
MRCSAATSYNATGTHSSITYAKDQSKNRRLKYEVKKITD